MNLRLILEQVPDPRGRQGRDYPLWSIQALIVVSLVSGRKGMKAAFELGRSLNSRQRAALGFTATTPCHATLTQTLRTIDPQALAAVLGALRINQDEEERHIAIDGKSMRASKDASGTSIHVVSAFCTELQATLGHEASRGRGFELPDALRLLDRIDLSGQIVTGDALFCARVMAAKITGKGGGFLLPVKDNQKELRKDIELAFNEPVFFPQDP